MSTKNSINNVSNPLSSTAITIDPGASGDSFIQYNINSTGEFRIGVDDTDDSFRISQGNALGTNDTFVMTSAGINTLPLQPCFLAILSSSANDVTGDNTYYTIIFDTEVFDIGSGYNNSTGIFTAPITGKYFLTSNVMYFINASTGGLTCFSCINTSNGPYWNSEMPTKRTCANFSGPGADSWVGNNYGVLADMDAGDTAEVLFASFGGSKTDDIYGAADPWTSFSGYLVL